MIRNERQYRISKKSIQQFQQAITEAVEASGGPLKMNPVIRNAHLDAMRSQFEDLSAEIREYEALVSGEIPVLELSSFADISEALIKARIASGLNQAELANILGVKPQQVQRYETTNYATASLDRI